MKEKDHSLRKFYKLINAEIKKYDGRKVSLFTWT